VFFLFFLEKEDIGYISQLLIGLAKESLPEITARLPVKSVNAFIYLI